MAYIIESVEELAQLTSARGASLDQQLSQEVEKCLLNRALCTLMAIRVNSRPKTRASLENALGPCTAVVPYANPLNVLADVNQESTEHAPSVRVPYAKKRVYVELNKLEEAHQEYLEKNKCTFAPWRSQMYEDVSERVVDWLQSDPEGTEETLISDLIEMCEPLVTYRQKFCKKLFTVSPSRVLTMNKKRLKHRRTEVTDEITVDIGFGKTNPDAVKTETRTTTVFSIGVLPGENTIKRTIEVTPEGVTGIKESTNGSLVSKTNTRLRAVGKCKEFSEILTNRLTYTALDGNAILIPASETEKAQMHFKVAEWVASFETTSDSRPTHTMIELQQGLINHCVGKIRRLAPSTIIDLLKKGGYITIDDEQSVTYNLPRGRHEIPNSWQDDTVKAAVDRCKCSGLLRKAFPRPKKADRKKRKAEHDELMAATLGDFGLIKMEDLYAEGPHFRVMVKVKTELDDLVISENTLKCVTSIYSLQ